MSKCCVYKCVAIRSDKTMLERMFRIPANWDYKTLAFILAISIEEYQLLDNIVIIGEFGKIILDCNKMNLLSDSFDNLKKLNMNITLNYKDDVSVEFMCQNLQIEESKKPSLSIHSIKGYNRKAANQEEIRYINSLAWNPEINRLYDLYHDDFLFKYLKKVVC